MTMLLNRILCDLWGISNDGFVSMSKKEYEKKRDAKRVSFNVEKEKELLEFANSVDFSNWVKQKIKEALN